MPTRLLAVLSALAALIAILTVAPSQAGAIPSTDLLFTQYMEGSSNNKALEIANTTGAPVDLSNYVVERYTNGSPTVSATIAMSGSLADGDVFVIANGSANPDILAVADLTTDNANWNGDDALVLRNTGSSAVIDSIGRVGEDPGSEWGDATVGTQNDTLCRLDAVTIGDTDPSDEFIPATEWEAKGIDNIDGLGEVGCETAPPVGDGDLLFTQYIEGSSNNKALEIANTTGVPVDLSSYVVERYTNGSPTVSASVALSGSLADDDVFVIANSQSAQAILDVADIQDGIAIWNGDDAIVLRNTGSSAVVDSIGRVGEDPGSEWGDATVGTQNDTLCRLDSVTAGDTDPSDEFIPATEWEAIGIDNFDGLGALGCDAAPELPQVLFTQYIEGSSSNKAIEIANIGSSAIGLDGYALELYSNGSPTASNVSSLTGLGSIAPNDVFVLSNASAGAALAALSDATATAVNWNGDDAIALRDPNGDLVDVIGQIGVDPGSQWGTNDLGTQNNTLCRDESITVGDPDGSDAFDPSIQWTALGIDVFTGLGEVGGCAAPPAMVKIHEVQGSGPTAALNGQAVTVQGIVTSLFERDDLLDGFFIQEEDADADADPATSEGIFVFCRFIGCPAALAVGDLVTVEGAGAEFFDMSQIDANSGSMTINSSGNPLPTPTSISLPASGSTRDTATFENVEGMLITVDDKLVVSEYFQLARYGEVVLTADARPEQFTDAMPPSAAGLTAFLADLATKRIILDDDNNDQNDATNDAQDNEPYPYPTGGLSTTNRFRGGDSITGLTGVMHWSFAGQTGTDAWRIRPSAGQDYSFIAENQRPAAPDAVGGSLIVASFNVLNYFTTLDEAGATCGPSALGCRGAHSAAELARQRDKIVSALIAMDADVVGLIEIENNASASVADLVAGLNASAGAGTYAFVDTGTIGGDAIKVALIYKPAAVSEAGSFAILDGSVDPTFIDDKNRPVLIQTFEEVGSGARFTVAVNHLKSKGSPCDDVGDPDLNDGQANCNLTRTAAATALANYLATDPTGSGDDDFLIIGDLNAYAAEDPITALTAAGYTDLVNQFEGPNAYSFVFDGQLGYLDHALANPALASQVTGLDVWHINADEVNLFDYNDAIQDGEEASFERESSNGDLYDPDPFRSSDHDPVIIGLALSVPGPTCNGLPATIVGTEGDDRLDGTNGDDVIVALGGNDFVNSKGGNDVVCAGDGNDRVFGGSGDDVLLGESGTDRLFGQSGKDTIDGGDGRDTLTGGGDDDTIIGGDQDDTIFGQGGDDDVDGGDGVDRIFGGADDDTLRGGDDDDIMRGGGGKDAMFGEDGDDRLFGNANIDTLDGGPGFDRLNGNAGNDTCTNGEVNISC